MIATDTEIFLSCSFAAEDAVINELVRGVCGGVGLGCVNVSAGFTDVPPEKAREFIAQSAGVIAVVTKRDRLEGGDFIMPAAVREEISIAFGLGKPILVIGEQGVRFDGFMNNYGTRLPFSRDELMHPAFIEKLVFSIYTFRHGVASTESSLYQYATEYISESTRNLISLDCVDSTYWWTTALTKRLRFETALQREIPSSVWPAVPPIITPGAPDAEWTVSVDNSSRPFEIRPFVRDLAPDRMDLLLHFDPTPQQGDCIEFTRTFRSQYLNPLFAEDLPPDRPPQVSIDGRTYALDEGLVLAERTKKLQMLYSFPTAYGLRPADLKVFAASHSFTMDYLTPWEGKRVAREIEFFGPKLIATLRVEEPVPRHMYGLAWNPPNRPDASS